jgi:hypothetical protein
VSLLIILCVKYLRHRHTVTWIVTSSTESYKILTDFRILRWLIIDVNSVLELLHCVLGDAVDVSEVHTVSMKIVSMYLRNVDIAQNNMV